MRVALKGRADECCSRLACCTEAGLVPIAKVAVWAGCAVARGWVGANVRCFLAAIDRARIGVVAGRKTRETGSIDTELGAVAKVAVRTRRGIEVSGHATAGGWVAGGRRAGVGVVRTNQRRGGLARAGRARLGAVADVSVRARRTVGRAATRSGVAATERAGVGVGGTNQRRRGLADTICAGFVPVASVAVATTAAGGNVSGRAFSCGLNAGVGRTRIVVLATDCGRAADANPVVAPLAVAPILIFARCSIAQNGKHTAPCLRIAGGRGANVGVVATEGRAGSARATHASLRTRAEITVIAIGVYRTAQAGVARVRSTGVVQTLSPAPRCGPAVVSPAEVAADPPTAATTQSGIGALDRDEVFSARSGDGAADPCQEDN